MATKSISIAKETTSQEILTKLATALTQAQNNGTNISSVLNQSQSNGTNIATLLSNLSKTLTQAQTNGTNINSVKSSLANGISVIKSVQRGVLWWKSFTEDSTDNFCSLCTVDINAVDPAKCMVIITGASMSSGSTNSVVPYSLTSTVLTVANYSTSYNCFSWQVIEFA